MSALDTKPDENPGDNKVLVLTVVLSVIGFIGLVFVVVKGLPYFFPSLLERKVVSAEEINLKSLDSQAGTCPLKNWKKAIKHRRPSPNCHFSCVICFERVFDDDQVHKIKCLHVFHKDCLEQWYLRGKYNCPQCERLFYQRPETYTGMMC